MADLRVELRSEIAAVRSEMALRSETAELRREIGAIRADMALRSETAELRRELAAVRAEMALRSDVDALRKEMTTLRTELRGQFLWLVGAMLSGFVTVIGALIGVVYLQMVS